MPLSTINSRCGLIGKRREEVLENNRYGAQVGAGAESLLEVMKPAVWLTQGMMVDDGCGKLELE